MHQYRLILFTAVAALGVVGLVRSLISGRAYPFLWHVNWDCRRDSEPGKYWLTMLFNLGLLAIIGWGLIGLVG